MGRILGVERQTNLESGGVSVSSEIGRGGLKKKFWHVGEGRMEQSLGED